MRPRAGIKAAAAAGGACAGAARGRPAPHDRPGDHA